VLVVVGAAGDPEFGTNFVRQAGTWATVCQRAGVTLRTIGLDESPGTNDLVVLNQALIAEPKDGPGEFWLVLIGHGTFDGREARFNLRGPDLSAGELATNLQAFHRPVAVLDTSSASAPFLNRLSASNRVIVTATRSGAEMSFTRFGQFLADALADPESDLDQDGQTSLLEAFLSASARVAEFYKTAGRLASEHALIDDNGDKLGTPAEWFRGVRATKKAEGGKAVDGLRAQQFHLIRSAAEQALPAEVRARRDALELAVARLRDEKSKLAEDEYYGQLEKLLLELARVYDAAKVH
jgi:hypothetical protein